MKFSVFKLNLLIFVLLYLIIILFSIHSLNGGILTTESENFLYYYTDSRPFDKKIFEIYRTDWGAFQSRELSYVFDFIDANLIKKSISSGFIHFYSFTHYFSAFVIAILSIYISRKYLKVKSIAISPLLSLLYITSPAIILGSSFFRSAKILTSLSLLFIIILLLFYINKSLKRKLIYVFLLIISVAMSLFDRQGFFVCAALAFITFLLWIFNRKKTYINFVIIFILATVFNIFYNYILGPSIIHSVAGYDASFEYQNLDYGQLIKQPNIFGQSILYILDIFSFYFGNLGRLFGIFISAFLLYIMIRPIKTLKDDPLFNQKNIVVITISSFIFLIVLYTVMGLRHPAIFFDHLKLTYYPLLLYMLILFLANVAIGRMLILWPKINNLIVGFLMILSLFNVIALFTHYELIKERDTSQHFIMTKLIKECIRNKQLPAENFLPFSREISVCKAMRGEIIY